MPVSENAGRSNAPSLRESVSHVDDLKELLELNVRDVKELLNEKIDAVLNVMKERDDRYSVSLKSMDEINKMSLANSKEAINKAEIATEKRFDSVNEFRGTLADQAAKLMPTQEANARFKVYDDKIEDVKNQLAVLREKGTGMTVKESTMERIAEQGRSKFEFNANTLLAIAAIVMSVLSPIIVSLIMFYLKGIK